MKKMTDLLSDYFHDNCSREDEIAIEKWLAENGGDEVDEAFQKILSEIRVDDATLAREGFEKFRQRIGSARSSSSAERLRRTARLLQRVAALLFIPLLALSGYLFLKDNPQQMEWNDITIPNGTQQALTLSDGTVLHLNAGTRVIYPAQFTGDKREIFINGEVFADVAKDPDKPFIISAGDIQVEVLGTQFNFRAYNNLETVEVALVEGAVLFETENSQQERLKAGEMVQYNRTTRQINRELFLTHQYKSPSKNEGFYFSNLTLGDIAKELEYYFDTDIVILDDEFNSNRYVAYFTNNETLDEILSDLNVDGKMMIKQSQNMIFIDKRH